MNDADLRLTIESEVLGVVSAYGGKRIIAGPSMYQLVQELTGLVLNWRAPHPVDGYGAERIASEFHAAYEALAPGFGYETRRESAVAWDDVPEPNRALMTATVQALLDRGVITAAPGDPTPDRTETTDA